MVCSSCSTSSIRLQMGSCCGANRCMHASSAHCCAQPLDRSPLNNFECRGTDVSALPRNSRDLCERRVEAYMKPACQLEQGFAKEQGPQLWRVPVWNKYPPIGVHRNSVIDNQPPPVANTIGFDVVLAGWTFAGQPILVLRVDELPEELSIGNACLQTSCNPLVSDSTINFLWSIYQVQFQST